MATRGYYEEFSIEELKDLTPKNRQLLEQGKPSATIEESIVDDDIFYIKTWTQAYKFASYYFDYPSNTDRFYYMNKFRFHFANLLEKTASPSELPDMRSRADLVGWVCKKQNEFLEKGNGNFRVDCNVEKLMQAYGPNFDNVKKTIGEYDYYY